MYSLHYAFQKSFNFSVSYLYVFVAQPCHLLKDNRIDFGFSQHKNTLFYFDNYMTIIRPSVQNSEYLHMCTHKDTGLCLKFCTVVCWRVPLCGKQRYWPVTSNCT